MTYILIIVLSFGGSASSTTIQQEFLSKDRCEAAMKTITTNLLGSYVAVRSQGCYLK